MRVAVAGGGAAGMTFAANAAERGHAVTLFEASGTLGGQLLMARIIPGKTEFNEMLRYLTQRLDDTGVDVRLNHAPTAAELVSAGYDSVVVASGVRPRRLDIPGIDHPMVLDYVDVLLRRRKVGQRVAIIGAGGIGFDMMEFLLGGEPGVPPRLDAFAREYALDLTMHQPGGLIDKSVERPRQLVTMLEPLPGDSSAPPRLDEFASEYEQDRAMRQSSGKGLELPRRHVTLLQRKSAAFGKTLGASTSRLRSARRWAHRPDGSCATSCCAWACRPSPACRTSASTTTACTSSWRGS
jgi:hypothetical protein